MADEAQDYRRGAEEKSRFSSDLTFDNGDTFALLYVVLWALRGIRFQCQQSIAAFKFAGDANVESSYGSVEGEGLKFSSSALELEGSSIPHWQLCERKSSVSLIGVGKRM